MQEGNTYSLKKIIIFGIIILVLAGLIGFYFVTKKNNTSDTPGTGKDLFPFGNGTSQTTTSQTIGGNVDESGTPQPSDGTPIATTDEQRLRQITQYPVTNFFPFTADRQILQPKLDEATQQTKLVASTTPVNMLRWNIKQTGLLMDAEISRDAIITHQKTSTRIPVAEELWVGNNGKAFGFRTWNNEARTVDTVLGVLPVDKQLGYCTVPFTQNLVLGSKTSDVKELQKYLNAKLSLNLALDGSLGPKTFALIKNLQTLLGTTSNGVYDESTKEAINTDCTKITATFEQEKNKPTTLTISLLPKNISRGTVSPDGTQYFFLVPNQQGVAGFVSDILGNNQRKIFESPATEWMPEWVSQNTISMTTLATRESGGYLYFLDPKTGDFKKILGPLRGLTTRTSPDAQRVLLSTSTDKSFTTSIYTVATGARQNLDLTTLPAKCTWQDATIIICGVPKTIIGGQYPDSWYQGTTSFSDTLWSINTLQNTSTIILTPEQPFDTTHIKTSPDRQYLYFINKSDQTLWSYRM